MTSPPYTDAAGYRMPHAPPGWPFGRLRPGAARVWVRHQERAAREAAFLGALKAPF
jgi:hypothetical protein